MPVSIKQRFDARAARYDNRFTALIGKFESRQIRTLLPPRSRVLDYGCGTGRTTLDLLTHGHHVTAYDISLKMLSLAREKVQKLGLTAEFVTDPAQLRRQSWPVITCIGVLDYYPDPLPVLRDLIQYLDDLGILIVTFPNALSPLAWLYALGSHWTIPAILRTPRSARQMAQQAGLRVEKLLFAFPSIAPLGHTLILRTSPVLNDCTENPPSHAST